MSGKARQWLSEGGAADKGAEGADGADGAEDWIQLTKVTCLGHIASSNTNLDQIASWESRTSINLQILIKHQHLNNSNNLNKFWIAIFTRKGHINQVY